MPDPHRHPPRRVAVVGSGVAGLAAAYVAARTAHVTLFEADDRLGGHAHTHQVRDGDRELSIDTGFIVHNDRTYPTLMRIFDELAVPTQASEMSMSVRSDEAGLEYAGALGPRGLFPTRRHLTDPAYLRMLVEVPRLHRMARRLLRQDADTGSREETFGEFLDRGRFTPYFRRHFAQALVAAVWSCDPQDAAHYPARYLFTFLQHHGMLRVFGSPQWRTVTGGSQEYVARLAATLHQVHTGTKVTRVHEHAGGVAVTDGNGVVHDFDAAVVATHSDQALSLLAAPTAAQQELLGAMPYTTNRAVLHTDSSVLPRSPRARASWNLLERPGTRGVSISYDLTRLMRLPTQRRYLVTLGGEDLIDPATVLARMQYEHPSYTPDSVAAQRRAAELDSDRLAFAGAWRGWGFHEDGARSGVEAAARLGFDWPAATEHPRPSLYRTTIRHLRRRPMRHEFSYRSHTWLVDLDDLPDHGVLGRFEARDHLGSPTASIRDNVVAFLAEHGEDRPVARILMAANARAFGHCFNPISVFWCLDAQGSSVATVVQVHNTYGGRHAYLVHPDSRGRARVDKALYVSPFHGTDGHYDLVVPVPGERIEVAVRLTTDDGAVFTATLSGDRVDGTSRGSLVRAGTASALGALRIRRQGIALWARGLVVRPRPPHPPHTPSRPASAQETR